MQVTGTKEAFFKMLSERGIYKKLCVDKSTVSNWKRNVTAVTLDKMEEILIRSGAEVLQDKTWNIL